MDFIAKGHASRCQALLDFIVDQWEVQPDGSLKTSSMVVMNYEGALIQMLDAGSSSLPVSEFEACARRALRAFIIERGEGAAGYNSLLAEEVRRFKRKPLRARTLCSRGYFALPPGEKLELSFWGARLEVGDTRPASVSEVQAKLPGGKVALSDPPEGAYVLIEVRARTDQGALDLGASKLSAILGILNFSLNVRRRTWSIFRSGLRNMPVAVFPGEEVFLLGADGVVDVEKWRYYVAKPRSVRLISSAEMARIRLYPQILSLIESKPKRDHDYIERLFRTYFDALCELDDDVETIRIWKVAELLTDSQRAEEISRRLALTWDDPKVVSAICFALGHRRNLTVHNAVDAPKIESLVGMFRHFLEMSTLRFLQADIKSVAHWRTVMKLSPEVDDLQGLEEALATLRLMSKPV